MRIAALTRVVLLVMVGALALAPEAVLGCSVCFGKSDSAMARGMNMGIFSLLGVITTVLLGVASFFVFLARRSAPSQAEWGDAD
ncbi:MAG: hypothetical protein AB9869_36810 [Verrucomicrobiia bacterium]